MLKKLFAPGNDSTLTASAFSCCGFGWGFPCCSFMAWINWKTSANTPRCFRNPIGIGVKPGLALVTFAETVGALLLALGLLTRFGALTLVIDLAVAFFMVHKMAVGMAAHSGELAFIYLAGFVLLLIAGPGKFSVDQALFGKGK